MTMTRPGWQSTSTTDENIEAVKKMILDNQIESILKRLLIMLAYRSAHAEIGYGTANFFPKLLNLSKNNVV